MIGQINIVIDESEDSVEGYHNISIDKLQSITNGYVESIVFTTIDKIDSGDRQKALVESLKKIMPGGQLTIRFLNLLSLASKLKASHIDGDKFSSIVKGLKSFWTESDFLGIISSVSDYKLIKIINEDLHLIAVIEKNK